jgi:hypothetical protein
MRADSISHLNDLANQYYNLMEQEGDNSKFYLKLGQGDKLELVSSSHGFLGSILGFFVRVFSRERYKFQPLAERINKLYKETAASPSQVDQEKVEKLAKFTSWFEKRVQKYNTPSLFHRLFHSQQLLQTASEDFGKIRFLMFVKTIRGNLLVLDAKDLSHRLNSPLGSKQGFKTVADALDALKSYLNDVALKGLGADLKDIMDDFKRDHIDVPEPVLLEVGELNKNISESLAQETLTLDEWEELLYRFACLKNLISIDLPNAYQKEFEDKKIPEWDKQFEKLCEIFRKISPRDLAKMKFSEQNREAYIDKVNGLREIYAWDKHPKNENFKSLYNEFYCKIKEFVDKHR